MNEQLHFNLASDYIFGFGPLCLTFGGDAMRKTYLEVYVYTMSLRETSNVARPKSKDLGIF